MLMENELVWRLINSFSPEKLKKKHSGTNFFSGVNKRLLLQSHVGRTSCTKSLQKPWLSKRYITFVLIATTHPRRFSWFFFFFCKAAMMSRDSCSPLCGSLALSHAEKNQGKPLWPGWLHISRRKIYSLMLQLHHNCYNFSKIEQNHK